MVKHFLFPLGPFGTFAFRYGTFSDLLHDIKGKRALKAHVDQISHYVISRTYGCRYCSLAFFDNSLRIVQPYIGSVRQTRYSDKIGECGRLCINKHLYDKIRSEFRYSETPQRAPSYIIRRYSQSIGGGKQTHNLRIIKRNLFRIRPCKILQHPDHCRIIVSENIKL